MKTSQKTSKTTNQPTWSSCCPSRPARARERSRKRGTSNVQGSKATVVGRTDLKVFLLHIYSGERRAMIMTSMWWNETPHFLGYIIKAYQNFSGQVFVFVVNIIRAYQVILWVKRKSEQNWKGAAVCLIDTAYQKILENDAGYRKSYRNCINKGCWYCLLIFFC